MSKQTSINLDVTINPVGFVVSGGQSGGINSLEITGGDIELVGSNSSETYTFPSTSTILVGADVPNTFTAIQRFSAGISASGATFSGNLNVGFTYGFGITLATNAIKRDLGQKLRDFCNVKDFGAVGDGTTDDSLAFQNAYNFLRFTVPTGICSASPAVFANTGTIYVPRGRYRLDREFFVSNALDQCNTFQPGITGITCSVHLNSALGIKFQGDGAQASILVSGTTSNSSVFFARPYSFLEFHDLGFLDISGNTLTTQRNCIMLNGFGGGRNFYLNNIYTEGFKRVVVYTCDVNEDTNFYTGCYFQGADTVIWARNTQALVNNISNCSFFEIRDAAIDVRGFEYLHVDSATVIMPGIFLKLTNNDLSSVGQYTITNSKWEFWPQIPQGGTSKVLSLTGGAYVKFINCGIAGGSAASGIHHFDLEGQNYIIELDGGQWGDGAGQQTNIRTAAHNAKGAFNAWGVICKNLASAPNRTITRTPATHAISCWPPVVFQNCVGVENIYLRGNNQTGPIVNPVGGLGGLDRNKNTKNNNGWLVSGSVGTTHTFSSYGQRVFLESIKILVGDTVNNTNWGGLTGITMQVFAGNTLISQIRHTQTPPYLYDLTPVNPLITTEDIKIFIPQTEGGGGGAGVGGLVFVDTVSL